MAYALPNQAIAPRAKIKANLKSAETYASKALKCQSRTKASKVARTASNVLVAVPIIVRAVKFGKVRVDCAMYADKAAKKIAGAKRALRTWKSVSKNEKAMYRRQIKRVEKKIARMLGTSEKAVEAATEQESGTTVTGTRTKRYLSRPLTQRYLSRPRPFYVGIRGAQKKSGRWTKAEAMSAEGFDAATPEDFEAASMEEELDLPLDESLEDQGIPTWMLAAGGLGAAGAIWFFFLR